MAGYDYGATFPEMDGETWVSDFHFKLGRIAGLFKIANKSLSSLYGDSDFKLNENDLLGDIEFNVDGNVGAIVYMSIWLGVAVIFTIVGMVWCCCNKCCCCCRSSYSGKGSRDMDDLENTDPSLRPYYSERNNKKFGKSSTGAIVLAILTAVWLIGFLLMIVHTFAANQKTKGTFNEVSEGIDDSIADVKTYLTKTREQLEFTFVKELDKFEEEIDKSATECRVVVTPIEACDILDTKKKAFMDETKDEIKRTNTELQDALKEVEDEIDDARDDIDNDVEDIMSDVNIGLYWLFMLFNLLYCVIFVLILIGTILAVFSKANGMRIGGHLMIRGAITLMFILGIFVVTKMLVMFAFSGITTEIVCPALRELEEEPTISSISLDSDHVVAPFQTGAYDFPGYGSIMRGCKRDESAYTAFHLETAYNVEDLKTRVDNELAKLVDFWDEDAYGDEPVEVIAFREKIEKKVTSYTDFVIDSVRTRIGKCQPVYNAINSTVTLFCHKVTAPVAAYWWILQFVSVTFPLFIVTGLILERV